MADDWLTLNEAAQQLGIAARTARRWIREGKLHAELRAGPYGEQYYVAPDQINTAQEIRDVVQVDRQADVATLARVLSAHLAERDGALISALEGLRAEVREATRLQEEREAALRAELAQVASELRQAREALDRERKRRWWRLWRR